MPLGSKLKRHQYRQNATFLPGCDTQTCGLSVIRSALNVAYGIQACATHQAVTQYFRMLMMSATDTESEF
jgi:hypothetical protein